MRDFSWKYFAKTGCVESYLLYKECTKPDYETNSVEQEHEEALELSPL